MPGMMGILLFICTLIVWSKVSGKSDPAAFTFPELVSYNVSYNDGAVHHRTRCTSPNDDSSLHGTKLQQKCLPGFIIAGVQKSGTTALAAILSTHPNISFAKHKEVHYFDLTRKYQQGLPFYLNYFRNWSSNETINPPIFAEATPFYLASRSACRRMSLTVPDIKLIVLLRDPLKRAYSEYQMKKRRVEEQFLFFKLLQEHSMKIRECMRTYQYGNGDDDVSSQLIDGCVPVEIRDHARWSKVKLAWRKTYNAHNDWEKVVDSCFPATYSAASDPTNTTTNTTCSTAIINTTTGIHTGSGEEGHQRTGYNGTTSTTTTAINTSAIQKAVQDKFVHIHRTGDNVARWHSSGSSTAGTLTVGATHASLGRVFFDMVENSSNEGNECITSNRYTRQGGGNVSCTAGVCSMCGHSYSHRYRYFGYQQWSQPQQQYSQPQQQQQQQQQFQTYLPPPSTVRFDALTCFNYSRDGYEYLNTVEEAMVGEIESFLRCCAHHQTSKLTSNSNSSDNITPSSSNSTRSNYYNATMYGYLTSSKSTNVTTNNASHATSAGSRMSSIGINHSNGTGTGNIDTSSPAFSLSSTSLSVWNHMLDRCLKVRTGITTQYFYRSMYAVQLHHCFQFIPREQFLILPSGLLKRDPESTLRQIYDFLGLVPPPSSSSSSPSLNQRDDGINQNTNSNAAATRMAAAPQASTILPEINGNEITTSATGTRMTSATATSNIVTNTNASSSDESIIGEKLATSSSVGEAEAAIDSYERTVREAIYRQFPNFERSTGWKLHSDYEPMPVTIAERMKTSFFNHQNRLLVDLLQGEDFEGLW